MPPAQANCPKDKLGKAKFSEVSPGDNEWNCTQLRYQPNLTKNTLHFLPYRNITGYITYTKITDYQEHFERLPSIEFKNKLQMHEILAVLISHLYPFGYLRTNLSYQPPQEVCFAKSFLLLLFCFSIDNNYSKCST